MQLFVFKHQWNFLRLIFIRFLGIFFLLNLASFSFFSWAIPRNTRSELHRYTILRDRVLTERAFKGIHKQNYFNLDIHISDGLKSFFGDVKNSYQDSSVDSSTRINNVDEVLNQHMNTEYFLDVETHVGIPLPDIKINKFVFHPSLFGGYNNGGSLSITNATAGSTARIKAYVKSESRAGVNVMAKMKEPYFIDISFYHMNRKDDSIDKDATQIVNEQKFVAFNGLNNNQNSQRFDILIGMEKKNSVLTFSVDELIFARSDTKPEYGNYALYKLQYYGHFKKDSMLIEPVGGIHYRARYALHKGLYAGVKVEKKDFPLKGMAMLDPEMVTASLRFEYKLFRAAYTVKLPHQNPVDNVWVHKINSFMINFNF